MMNKRFSNTIDPCNIIQLIINFIVIIIIMGRRGDWLQVATVPKIIYEIHCDPFICLFIRVAQTNLDIAYAK